MYVTRLATEGLRHAPPELDGLDRVVELPGPPARQALADGLMLLAAALNPALTRHTVESLGWGDHVEIDEDDGDVQILELEPAGVQAMLSDEARAITIEATMHLDPPLYGRLRSHAARDPRVVTALGQDAALSVKVGWLFNLDGTAVAPSLLGVRVGGVAFETAGRDRPPWLPGIVRQLGERFLVTDPYEPLAALFEKLRQALMSADAEVREGFAAWGEQLTAPPFDLPAPAVVEVGGTPELVFGPELLRARQLGRSGADAARIVHAAMVGRPDVLVVPEDCDTAVTDWLGALPTADAAPIEQVWLCR